MIHFQNSDNLIIEGFVVRFSDGTRIKIKSKRYFEIAKIISNLTPKAVFDSMKNGLVPLEYLQKIPEEFRDEINHTRMDLEHQYHELKLELTQLYHLYL